MPEILHRIEGFKQQLQAMGIPADKVHEVAELLADYKELQNDLQAARTTQFVDDAREIIYKLGGRGQNKVVTTSVFLRDFAEHIAGYIVGREGTVTSLVDQIPAMSQDRQ